MAFHPLEVAHPSQPPYLEDPTSQGLGQWSTPELLQTLEDRDFVEQDANWWRYSRFALPWLIFSFLLLWAVFCLTFWQQTGNIKDLRDGVPRVLQRADIRELQNEGGMPKDLRNLRIAETIFGWVGMVIIILVYFARPKPGARMGGSMVGVLFVFVSAVLAWVAFGVGLGNYKKAETCPDNYRMTLEGNSGHRRPDGTFACWEKRSYAFAAITLDAANGFLGLFTAILVAYNTKQGHWRMAPRGWKEAQLDAEVEPQKERIPGEMIQKNVTYVRKWLVSLSLLLNMGTIITLGVFFIFLHEGRELAEAHPLGGPVAAPNANGVVPNGAPTITGVSGCHDVILGGYSARGCTAANFITITGTNFDSRTPAANSILFVRGVAAKGSFPTCSPISSATATQITCPLWVPHGSSGWWNVSVVVSGVRSVSDGNPRFEVLPPGGGWPTQNTRLRYSASAIGILTVILNVMPFRSKAVAYVFAMLYLTSAALCMVAFGFDIHSLRRVGSSRCPLAPDFTSLACVKSPYIATTIFEFFVTLSLLFYIIYEYVIKQRQQCQHCQRNYGYFELEKHVTSECSRRPVQCAVCSKTMLAKEFVYKHRHECAVDHVPCERCGNFVPAWGLKAHTEECPHFPVKCTMCEGTFMRADLAGHVAACPNKPTACDACGETFRGQAIDAHRAECPEMLVQCELCDDKMQRFRLSQHQTVECPKRNVSCQGCGSVMPSFRLERHLRSECGSQ